MQLHFSNAQFCLIISSVRFILGAWRAAIHLKLPGNAHTSVLISITVTKQIAAKLANERSAKYVSYAARQFAAREPEIYASFTFLDAAGTIHHLPVSDSRKYHPLSAVIPRLSAISGLAPNFRKEIQVFFPPPVLLRTPSFPVRARTLRPPPASFIVSSRLGRKKPPECSRMHHDVPRASNTISRRRIRKSRKAAHGPLVTS